MPAMTWKRDEVQKNRVKQRFATIQGNSAYTRNYAVGRHRGRLTTSILHDPTEQREVRPTFR